MYVLGGGEQYVSFEDIRCIAPYIAGDNIEIKLENKVFHINHTGVAIHPGDRGMEIYADRLFEAITHKKNEIKYDGSKKVKPDLNKILFIIQNIIQKTVFTNNVIQSFFMQNTI